VNIVFTFVFVGGCIAVGLLLAILVDQHIRGESIFRSIFLFPMALSFVVTGTVWAWILNPNQGINVILDAIGIDTIRKALLDISFLQPLWNLLDTLRVNIVRPGLTADPRAVLGALGIAAVWQMSGFVMALYLAGLRGVSDELREAGRVDGASEVKIYRHIVIPQLRPTTVTAIVLLGYTSLKMFDLVFVLTKGGPALASDLPSIFMWETTFKSHQTAHGAAVAILMLAAAAALILPYVRRELRGTAR
jgi:glucose/mannose transport system permease protein